MSLLDMATKLEPEAEERMETGENTIGRAVKQQQDETQLDLVFAMDCTGSMGSYIHQAQAVSHNVILLT